ncbi:MAG: TlpA family protein disulfide reductase [Sphingobacteriales bacterium]|nr:MAG: TlpA family protein disulfide reductase [Sphingobacteriales bacterium]
MNMKAFFGKLIYVLPLVFLAANCNSQKQAANTTENKTETVKEEKKSTSGFAMQVPEISQNNPEGQQIALSSLQGHIVLIDFWASWCPPCRAANPELVELYKKYNGKKFKGAKGFEIYSVSLDQDPNKWKAAIAKDGLVWKNHVSDLRGWESAAARSYGVNSIPASLLMDEKGTVVGTNMPLAEMMTYLDGRLK